MDQEQVEARLVKLPRGAIVAFAARCARRAQSVFKLGWPDAPPKHCQSIRRAVTVAEQGPKTDRSRAAAWVLLLAVMPVPYAAYASTQDTQPSLLAIFAFLGFLAVASFLAADFARPAAAARAAANAYCAADAASEAAALTVAHAAYTSHTAAHAAAVTAAHAAYAVHAGSFAASRSVHTTSGSAAANATNAFSTSHVALATYCAAVVLDIATSADLELLEALTEREQWTNASPVPQSVCGELWPNGPPEGFQ